MPKTVLISPLGINLDRSYGEERWERWRPSISLCQQEDLEVDRMLLLADPKFGKLSKQIEADIGSVSPHTEVRHVGVPLRDPWDFAEVYAGLLDFVDSYPFDPDQEDYLVHMTTGTHVMQICLFLLVETRRIPGRLIQTSPPPRRRRGHASIGTYSIIDLDLSRYDRLAARFEAEHQEGVAFLKSGIPTRNETFNQMMDRMEQVAQRSTDPMLLTGPTGVGKTALAQRIYTLQHRLGQVQGEYVEVNCATLRGDGAMAALFGHTKGAFTGATSAREGLLQRADRGLLFLDEIGELGLDEQAMLLRALEVGTYLPLGSDEPKQVQFQLLAGTNRDLPQAVRAGQFREDLLARIDLWTFALPPLRERPEDIEPNLDFELARIGQEWDRTIAFNKEARARFLAFATAPSTSWRANFRDFGGSLRRLATLAHGGRISLQLVEDEIERLQRSWQRFEAPANQTPSLVDRHLPGQELDRFERAQLEEVLQVVSRSPSMAAAGRELFAVSRLQRSSQNDGDRLRKYLARFGLDWDRLRS